MTTATSNPTPYRPEHRRRPGSRPRSPRSFRPPPLAAPALPSRDLANELTNLYRERHALQALLAPQVPRWDA